MNRIQKQMTKAKSDLFFFLILLIQLFILLILSPLFTGWVGA